MIVNALLTFDTAKVYATHLFVILNMRESISRPHYNGMLQSN